MDVNLERRALEILGRLMDKEPSDGPEVLERECQGDATLRRRVEELLASHQAVKGMLSTAEPMPEGARRAGDATTAAVRHGEGVGTHIGAYKLLELIGEGGFGSVFLAEQESPVRRRVALKIIKLGMDTRQVIARFEAERQALAIMDHPNIAKVFDAGATESGRPYFVMELVRGIPITEYCDKNSLDVPERLALFQQVCHAVQHAHQKGVIHRDIKPSNVLVTSLDSQAVPKVIDFGIAKATSAHLTEKTLFTEHRALIGTPEYMSPEQADLTANDIDTRSDVYSLGVLLYELLTGALPFDSKRLRSAAYAEIQRIIQEEEPPKPSTRLSRLEALPSIAARRNTEPARLSRVIKGDLDWIAMRCLEKNRTRRYETANGLAADIGRYLRGETVVAAPPSSSYRLRKFVRRNRGPVTGVAAVAGALVLGVIGFAWQAHQVGLQRDVAITASDAERAARQIADQERTKANVINNFLRTALRSSDPNQGGSQGMLVADAMLNSVRLLDEGAFADQPQIEADLMLTISQILNNNGRLVEADSLAERALAIYRRLHPGDHPLVAQALNNLAEVRRTRGSFAEAEPLNVQALAMRRRLFHGDHSDVAESLNDLAIVREALGDPKGAEPLYVQALEMFQRVHPGDHPSVAQCLNNVAYVWQVLDRTAEAEPQFVRALEMFKRLHPGDHPSVAQCLNNVAIAREAMGMAAKAEPLYREALQMFQRLYRGDHPAVAQCLNNLAYVLQVLERPEDAEPLHLQALEMRQRLFTGPNYAVAESLNNLGTVYLTQGHADKAESYFERALDMFRALYKGDSVAVAQVTQNLARTRHKLGNRADARKGFDESVAMLRRLAPDGSSLLARVLWRSATIRVADGEPLAALAEIEEAWSMAGKLLPPDHPHLAQYRETLDQCCGAVSK